MTESKWIKLLSNKDLKRWYENLQRGSSSTAHERIRILNRYLTEHHLTPAELVKMARSDKKMVEDQLHDFVTRLDKEGKSPGYIQNYVKAVKSWLSFNDIQLYRKIKIRNSQATPTIEDEQVPNRQELRDLLSYAGDRARVSISFIAFTGVRPQVLGNSEGLDGLRLKDLPELEIKKGEIKVKRSPMQVVVPAKLSKTNNKYITYLCQEGIDYLIGYLEKRTAKGEKLDRNSPVIATAMGYEKMGKSKKNYGSNFIETQNITREIRQAMRPRFNWRPYVLRAYFDTQLLLAESNGKISHAYRQFFMGHKGDIEARYTTNKGKLPQELIEDMRRTYKQSEIFISTERPPETDTTEIFLEMMREQAKAYGIDPKRVKVDFEEKGGKFDKYTEIRILNEEIIKKQILRQKASISHDNTEGKKHKIIKEKQLEKYLDEGWVYFKELPDGKYLLIKEK